MFPAFLGYLFCLVCVNMSSWRFFFSLMHFDQFIIIIILMLYFLIIGSWEPLQMDSIFKFCPAYFIFWYSKMSLGVLDISCSSLDQIILSWFILEESYRENYFYGKNTHWSYVPIASRLFKLLKLKYRCFWKENN